MPDLKDTKEKKKPKSSTMDILQALGGRGSEEQLKRAKEADKKIKEEEKKVLEPEKEVAPVVEKEVKVKKTPDVGAKK